MFHTFRGEIDSAGDTTFVSRGTVVPETRTSLRITELPVGKWTQDYKEFLDDLLKGDGSKAGQENLLKNYSEHHTGNKRFFSFRRDAIAFFFFLFFV